MAFSFGAGGTGGTGGSGSGFTFGSTTNKTTASTTQPTSGFSFGGGLGQKSSGSGFSFGQQSASVGSTAGSSSFSFGTPTTTAQKAPTAGSLSFSNTTGGLGPTGFALGNAPSGNVTSSATIPGGTGFTPLFAGGAPKPATTVAPTLGTVNPSQASSGGFNLGGQPAQSVNQGLTFGGTPAPSSGGLSLGMASTTGGLSQASKPTFSFTTNASASGGLTLGTPGNKTLPSSTPVVQPGGGFSLGGATGSPNVLQQPAPGVGLGASVISTSTASGLTKPSAASSGFTLGAGGTNTLGGLAKTAPTTGLSLSTTTATPSGGLKIGGLVAPSTTVPGGQGFKMPSTTTTAASTAGSVGFSLGGSTTTASTSGASGFGLGTATTTPVASLTTTTISTTSAGSGATVTSMTYKQLEEAINKWSAQLEEQEKVFLTQATQVNAWDRLLIENGDKIAQLNTDVERVKIDQQRLEHELDFILAQQRELEEMLVPLEMSVEKLPPISFHQHADVEREHTYQLAENIDSQLKQMVQDLKDIIDHLNSSNSQQDSNDPIHQISKILNAHMDSLQWVDQNSAILQRRVDEVSKQMEHRRKEQEKNFRLAYDSM